MNKKQKEYLIEISKTNTPLFPFDVIESKIGLLLMDRQILNKHPEDFPKEFRERLQKQDVEMAENLSFYIVQEIQDFYRQAYVLFKNKLNFPKTAEVIREFRGKVIAHIKTKSSLEIAEKCMELEERHGFDNIYFEWQAFKDEIYKKIKSGELQLPKQKNVQ